MVDMLAEQAKMVNTEAEVVDLGLICYSPPVLFFLVHLVVGWRAVDSLRLHRIVVVGRRDEGSDVRLLDKVVVNDSTALLPQRS